MTTTAQLIAAGFTEERYDGQDGTFLSKRQPAESMPYVLEHIVDHDEVHPETIVLVQVTPDNLVQLYIQDTDYLEGPHPIGSDEGQALLRDAGFTAKE